jgi:hypothetical protein
VAARILVSEGGIMASLGRLVTSRRMRSRTRWRTSILRPGLRRHLLEGLVTGLHVGLGVQHISQHISRSMHLRFPSGCPFEAKKVSRLISQLGWFGARVTRLRGQNSVCEVFCRSESGKCNTKANTFSHHPSANGIASHCETDGNGSTYICILSEK